MLACVTLLLPCWSGSSGLAQGTKRPAPAPVANSKSLDQQADKVQTEYLSGLADLATKYEEAGDVTKAVDMLKSILKIKPDADVVKARLKQLEESVFSDNVYSIDIEAGAGWVAAGVLVTKDKPVRFEADGTYKVAANDMLGPAGYPTQDLAHDMADGVPFGALMAMVGKSDAGARKPNQKDAPKPMTIGARREITPQDSGPLFFKINVPESAKCTGKVKVKITGNMLPVR